MVDSLRLSIGLRVEGCGLVAVDVAEFKEAGGESRRELSSAIGNDIIREAMVLENMLEV